MTRADKLGCLTIIHSLNKSRVVYISCGRITKLPAQQSEVLGCYIEAQEV